MALSTHSSDVVVSLNTQGEKTSSTTTPDDAHYWSYDVTEQRTIQTQKPWLSDPNYFSSVAVSALALMKMSVHARSGTGEIEVMGILQGKVSGRQMIVTDAFALPVEGTETRVNAAAEGYEYMVQYMELAKKSGRLENAIGWYHSHPGYGCWLSGIDVATQRLNQQYQEPWLAIVVDPKRTLSAGKVEIGAFRTYPEGYSATLPGGSKGSSAPFQSVPSDKIEDFGVHSKEYYPLPIIYFKSSADANLLEILSKQNWVATLSTSTLQTNQPFIQRQVADTWSSSKSAIILSELGQDLGSGLEVKSELEFASFTSAKLTEQATQDFMSQLLKQALFQ